jgi:SOS-response transcriptional repressor LexA
MHVNAFCIECYATSIDMSTDQEIGERLKAAREHAGYKSAAKAAEALGVPYPTYAGHENGSRGFGDSLTRYAQFFRVSIDWLLRAKGDGPGQSIASVPIVGKTGAGPDGSVLFAHTDGQFGESAPLINATQDTRALEVEGQSMRGMADDGSLIFYDAQESPGDSHVGELCICWLEDERVLIKYPFRGTLPGLWNLESTTAATLRDVPVRWFAHVTGVIPRKAARDLVRRRLDIQPVDTVVSR